MCRGRHRGCVVGGGILPWFVCCLYVAFVGCGFCVFLGWMVLFGWLCTPGGVVCCGRAETVVAGTIKSS